MDNHQLTQINVKLTVIVQAMKMVLTAAVTSNVTSVVITAIVKKVKNAIDENSYALIKVVA
jgi:ABC-type histidine transport system ATPase subunit